MPAWARTLARCVRSYTGEFLKSEYKWADPHQQSYEESRLSVPLQALWAPSHPFEFPLLADIFAKKLLPYEVVFRSVVLFKPARLETLGLPKCRAHIGVRRELIQEAEGVEVKAEGKE